MRNIQIIHKNSSKETKCKDKLFFIFLRRNKSCFGLVISSEMTTPTEVLNWSNHVRNINWTHNERILKLNI